nr:immunoglobulin light chain junction region [Macaca mulatta]MOV67561.1 immunoglobulin light chain junction region [Macaca mulatta]MOV69054.1 immunoglobulin light chain junction region [Macaca mulatta]MOV69612.1 immunoglobulin light chain junction region [Macaca mulatta]MOV71350.1 immunoglobulin light chain junction region [Macaca mulatta]
DYYCLEWHDSLSTGLF